MSSEPRTDDTLNPVNTELIQTLVQNRDRFRHFLSRRLDDNAATEEILQQALLKAVESEARSEKPDNIVPWFYRILRNALTDHYRSRSVDSKKAKDLIHELEATSNNVASSGDELRTAICQCLDGLIPTLKPEYAELIRKVDLEGRTPESVGKELNISSNNLWVRLHRARQALRKSLERSCGACSKHACLNCTCK